MVTQTVPIPLFDQLDALLDVEGRKGSEEYADRTLRRGMEGDNLGAKIGDEILYSFIRAERRGASNKIYKGIPEEITLEAVTHCIDTFYRVQGFEELKEHRMWGVRYFSDGETTHQVNTTPTIFKSEDEWDFTITVTPIPF